MVYTQLEQIELKYTVRDALDAAKRIMNERYSIKQLEGELVGILVKHIDDKITIVKLNELSDKLINETKIINKIKY